MHVVVLMCTPRVVLIEQQQCLVNADARCTRVCISCHTSVYKQAVRTVRGSVPGIIEAEDFDDDQQGIHYCVNHMQLLYT
jgi:hypothetical protein